MGIGEIYERYRIPFWLAEHMYRVAAVAMRVFDARVAVDPSLSGRDDMIAACLLHDIGNIVKFNFITLPPPDGRAEYWKKVQREMIAQYGTSEHPASKALCEELGQWERIAPILEHTSDYDARILLERGALLQRIVAYADQRVAPTGVVLLAQRLRDMRARYDHPDTDHIRALDAAIMENEQQLFSDISLKPEDITEQSIAPLLAELRSFEF